MEHADGCIFWDMGPPLKVLGVVMIGCGAMLMVFGLSVQKSFLNFLVRVAVFAILIVIFWKLHFFDKIDPTALNHRGPVMGYGLVVFASVAALIG